MVDGVAIKILVVDDDAQIRALLRSRLEKEGFLVAEARDGAGMRAQLETAPVNLITLDLSLGHEDGLALAREVRARQNVPIIIISGKSDEIDRVVGLELGADDYITKPFSPREVVARIRAVLRRYAAAVPATAGGADPFVTYPAGSQAAVAAVRPPGLSVGEPERAKHKLVFAGGTLDPARREFIAADGALVDLTTAEFNLLELFLERPQRVLTRDEIMNLLKGHDWSPFDRTVDSGVARLRRKIEDDADQPRHIKTVRGVGYIFAAQVQRG